MALIVLVLKQLGIPFQHKWSCEIDQFARQSILANYEPEILYTDITTRNHSQLPHIDMYVCGFPCQSFSLMGKKKGTCDPRSNIMLHCIKVIQTKLPNLFILENVKNFKFIEKGAPFNYLINSLNNIKDKDNESVYNVYYDIMNTKDYGIPQNRERIFIIGIKKEIQIDEYTKPNKLPLKLLDEFILDKTTYYPTYIPNTIVNKLKKINYKPKHICCCDGIGSIMENISPTLTFSGCKYMYHTTYNRYLTSKECLLLQGFPVTFINVIGDVKLCNQIGNSMSVNVLCKIYKLLFNITTYKYIL